MQKALNGGICGVACSAFAGEQCEVNDAIPRPQSKPPKAATPLLEVRNLTKSFDGQAAVDDVSLTIYKGEIFALLGASGCGKSTLLRMLAGFELPTQGQIFLDGQDLSLVPPYQRPINMMFQSYALFPHMTVEKNIAFGLKQDKLPRAEIKDRVEEMLSLVHMQEFANRKPHQLSGGQRQRVALARSLAKRPKLLLLDEPMGALDKKLRDRMQLEVVDILERVGVTCVMVTHDQEEAMTMAGRIAIMNRGKFVQIGEPEEIYEHPNTRFSAEFIGSVNMFEGILQERQDDALIIKSPGLVHPLKVDSDVSVVDGVPVYIALRPEKIMLCEEVPADGCNFAVGEVVHIAYLGDLSIYHVRLNSGQIISAQLQNAYRYRKGMPTWGDEVRLCWDADSCVVLTV
nr:putrescine ABC transporter ATP-binding subunit PotG [Pectobacterium polaris]